VRREEKVDAMKRRRMERTAMWAGLLLLGMTGAGCQAVKPWQRGQLGDPLMKPDRDPLGLALAEHVFFSREAAMGGRGVGGGGCGCN
jgi:hypothetical protein